MKNKKKRNLLLLLVLILTLSIGFALLSTTLFINGTSTIKGNTWDIHWDGESIVETQGSFPATTPAAVTDADETNISFAVEFELPGDYYEFTVDAVNEGTIDGIIESFDMNYYEAGSQEASDVPDNIIWTVKYADDTDPAIGDVLAKNETKKYKVKIQFDPEAKELPTTSTSGTYELSVKYQQHKGN